jgi:translation initiation factor 5A
MGGDKTLEDIGKLKPGRFILLDGAACKITNMEKSAPGKHGHAKYRVTAQNLVTGNKKIVILTGHAKVEVPIIEKKTAQVLSISGDTVQMMDLESYETIEGEIDKDEVKQPIEAGQQVLYWNIMGKKVIKQIKS